MGRRVFLLVFLLAGCAGVWNAPDDFEYSIIRAGDFEIATWQRITSANDPVHIYIEGDGRSFNSRGMPTSDPTPRGMLVRDLVERDISPNVAYIARPCQFVMSDSCTQSDWTDGRFSARVIDSVATVVQDIAQDRPVVLIGYSGGAMVSGLIIKTHPEINVEKWITIAGVLNHSDWTQYFGDRPLSVSLNMDTLPHVPQTHYVAEKDRVVPPTLTFKWVDDDNIVVVPDATHGDFGDIGLDFSI